MNAKTIVPTLLVSLALGSAVAGAGEAQERRASVLRAEAAELRMKAEAMRDAKGNNPQRAKELDRRADALIEKANSVDSIQWPPGN
jgi:cytochrome c556